MAHLSLPNSELHLGVDFSGNARVRALLAEPGTMLLFPGEGAAEPSPASAPRTLVILDGTWSQARNLLRQNPLLRALPRLGLQPAQPSNYRIRREPAAHLLSTIEATAQVLGALEGEPDRFLGMLRGFEWMIDHQLESQATHKGPPRVLRRKENPRVRVDGKLAELRARPQDVVAVCAEGNGAEPPELLQLVAVRTQGGERFEAVVLPRGALHADAEGFLELPPGRLARGESVASALARFAAFLRPGDLFCGFGPYAAHLLRREGAAERPFSDLRLAAARHLGRRAGGVEQALRMLGQPDLPAPLGEGRAGRRLASLLALLELLPR